MSRDLLADLDSFYQPSGQANYAPHTTTQEPLQNSTAGHANDFLDFGSWAEAPSANENNAFAVRQYEENWQVNNEDDFGDFESGQADETTIDTEHNVLSPSDPWSNLAGMSASLPVPSNTQRTTEVEQQQYFPRPAPLHEQRPVKKAKAVRKPATPRDPNVFFDAEDNDETDEAENGDDDDDFGSFAVAEEKVKVEMSALNAPPSVTRNVRKEVSLLDFDEDSAPGFASSAVKPGFGVEADDVPSTSMPSQDPSGFEWVAFETNTAKPTPSRAVGIVSTATPKPTISLNRKPPSQPPTPAIPKPSTTDDAWDDFDTLSSTPISNTITVSKPSTTQPLPISSPPPTTIPPPSNIPPPSVLLSLFAPLIKTATTQLFAHTSEQHSSTTTTAATRTAILSHPTTTAFLHSYLLTATVLARIIAGRKLRWKRDTHLAQNMRIGPSSASRGGGGGMKLAGVDKGEVSKEDRELADVLRLWRAQVGKLRSAVSSINANATGSATGATLPLSIPEITETPVVRVAKESEGGVVVAKQCVVCALKRNERVSKVDVNVEDVFGEWWVEHWGHRSCVAFWRGHEAGLRSR